MEASEGKRNLFRGVAVKSLLRSVSGFLLESEEEWIDGGIRNVGDCSWIVSVHWNVLSLEWIFGWICHEIWM